MHTENPKTAGHTLSSVLDRISIPLFLFTLVLVGVLAASKWLLLPEFTQVEVGGKVRNTASLTAHASSLKQAVLSMENRREEMIAPLRSTVYGTLQEQKSNRPSYFLVVSHIQKIAAEVEEAEGGDVVYIHTYEHRSSSNEIVISGTVRDVGARSMTVLAEFVEKLKHVPIVSNVTLPTFERTKGDDGKYVSPFTIRLSLS